MAYIPNQGDIIYLDFDPQAGHEQRGRRPALVISNLTYNTLTKMALVCPITSTNRNFPLHVQLNSKTKTSGFIMCEQVKALDINFRNATFHEQIPSELMHEIFDIIYSVIEIE